MRDGAADALHRLAAEAAAVVAGDSAIEMESARRAYLESVIAGTKYVDLGGISAKVGSRVVKIDLDEVFVEPSLEPEGATSDATFGPVDVLLLRHTVIIGGPGAGKIRWLDISHACWLSGLMSGGHSQRRSLSSHRDLPKPSRSSRA